MVQFRIPSKEASKGYELYIHLHAQNVGKGYHSHGERKGETDSNLVNKFKASRETVKRASLNQLKTNFLNSVSLNDRESELINQIMSNDENEMLSNLDQAIRPIFEKNIPSKLMTELMQQEYNLAQIDYNQLFASKAKSFETLNEIINIINTTAKLFGTQGKALADYLTLAQENKNSKGIMSLSNNVLKQLKAFQKQSLEGNALDIKGIQTVASQLESTISLIKNIYSGKIMPKDIAASVATSLENNLFSTAFAEWGAAKATSLASSEAEKIVTEVVGQNKGTMSYYDPSGRYVSSGHRVGQNKVDISTKNVSVHFNESQDSITMDIGISNKFYKTQGFKGLNKKSISISTGSGGTINQALTAIFGNGSSYLKYLVYNTIAYGNYFPQAFQELKRLVTVRQVLTLLSSRSKDDFAQVFYINGHVVTIYEIMSGLLNNMDNAQEILSLSGFTPVFSKDIGAEEDTPIHGSLVRSAYVHQKLKEKTISGDLHLTKLLILRK